MTIALGFKAPNGIVLCTDSQMTKSGGLKFNGKKIFVIQTDTASVALAFAGSADLMKPFADELEARLESLESDGPPITAAVFWYLEEVASEFSKKYKNESVELLCAVSDQKYGKELYSVRGKVVSTAEREYLGVGDSSVIRYLADLFGQSMTMRQCLLFGCYMVKQATNYIDGCGGPIQALVASRGSAGELDEAANGNEDHYGPIETWLSHLLTSVTNPDSPVGDRKIIADSFFQAVAQCDWTDGLGID